MFARHHHPFMPLHPRDSHRGPFGSDGPRPGFGGFPPFGPGFGPAFGPGHGPRGRSRARRGDVRLVLLSLLAEQESNGYGLIRVIAERTDGRWRPSPGSVYPTLQQLVDEGLVTSAGAGKGDSYRLSDEGREYVDQNAEEIASAWKGLPGHGAEEDDYWVAFMKLAKASRQFHSEATPEQRAQMAARFDALRKDLYGLLAE